MCGCKGNVNDDKSSVRVKSRLREFYQSRRPEFFSDSEVRYEVPLTRELFDLQLARLSTDKKHSEFEKFVVAVSRRLITPNIKPQTGPDGGGDGKVDAETYEVSDDISDKWYSEECGAHGKEKWAFTISCRSSWKEKIKSDVKKAVETGRGYARVLCFSNQLIKADLRLALEESLSKQYDVKVDIFDATWCRDAVFQNGCIDVALAELGFSDEYKRKTVKVVNRDFKRKQRLEEIEKSILRPIEGLDTGYVDELDEACILSRALDMPRVDVEGKFDRAVRECKRHGTEPQLFNIIYNHAWTSLFWFEDCQAAFEDYNKLKPFVEADSSVARIEKLTNLLTVLTAASRMSVTSINLSAEKDYVKNLQKIVEQDPNRQSCALFLKLQDATQRLIWETRDEKSLIEHLEALRPLLQAASMNLEIGFESHYDILKSHERIDLEALGREINVLQDEIDKCQSSEDDLLQQRRGYREEGLLRNVFVHGLAQHSLSSQINQLREKRNSLTAKQSERNALIAKRNSFDFEAQRDLLKRQEEKLTAIGRDYRRQRDRLDGFDSAMEGCVARLSDKVRRLNVEIGKYNSLSRYEALLNAASNAYERRRVHQDCEAKFGDGRVGVLRNRVLSRIRSMSASCDKQARQAADHARSIWASTRPSS